LALSIPRVNSKATLKVPLAALLQHVPSALHGELHGSRYLAERASALIIQADDSRKQNDNAHSCYRRLYEAIVDAGHRAIPGETSAEQADRVKKLYVDLVEHGYDMYTTNKTSQKSDNERRLKSKKTHSAKKSSRRGRGDD
jgi:peptidyl-tRNA hydrolase ICT1